MSTVHAPRLATDGAQDLRPADTHSIRRLDWRFLLPSPDLPDTGCLAPSHGGLGVAVQRCCPHVTFVRPGDLRQFSLLVAENLPLSDVPHVSYMVQRQGWIYVEFTRRYRYLSGWLRDPTRYSMAFSRLGFDPVTVCWHRPDFENCVEIIPLFESAAPEYAMSHRSPGLRNRLKFGLGSLLHRTHLLSRVVPCFSLLARRSDGYRA